MTFPTPEVGDLPELVSLLKTARDAWARFERAEAIDCLQRAIQIATAAGAHERAIDLAVAVAELKAAGEAQTQDVDVRRFRKSGA